MFKLIPLKELFTPVYGVNLELIHLEECNKNDDNSIMFVSRTESNNGISAYVKRLLDIKPNPAHTISVAVSGSVLSSFYQSDEYYSGRDLYYLVPKIKMSKEEMIFYAFCIKANKYKYNYGRAANRTLRDIPIPAKMPADFRNISLNKIPIPSSQRLLNKDIELKIENWKSFQLKKILKVTLGKPIHKNNIKEFSKNIKSNHIAYVTRTAENNGVELYVDKNQVPLNKIGKGNAITLGAEGFKAFYQKDDFITGNKINILRNDKLNLYNALFLSAILNLEINKKFGYGRGLVKSRIEKLSTKLPVNKNGEPDFELMENFIKSLPYSSSI